MAHGGPCPLQGLSRCSFSHHFGPSARPGLFTELKPSVEAIFGPATAVNGHFSRSSEVPAGFATFEFFEQAIFTVFYAFWDLLFFDLDAWILDMPSEASAADPIGADSGLNWALEPRLGAIQDFQQLTSDDHGTNPPAPNLSDIKPGLAESLRQRQGGV